jgi:uncharacterized protein (DUF1501 family)
MNDHPAFLVAGSSERSHGSSVEPTESDQQASFGQHLNRRQLLQLLGMTGAAGASGLLAGCSLGGGESASAPTSAASGSAASSAPAAAKKSSPKQGADAKGRVLVVVEIGGGYDGFAALVPYGDGRFRKLRERIWVDQKELVMLDDRYGLNKGLEPVKDRLAFVEGVGVAKPDLSHFSMMQRWWNGDPDGTGAIGTGVLGRCCDALHGDEAVIGVSLGSGSSPAMVSEAAPTVSLPQLDGIREISKSEPNEVRLRTSLSKLTADDLDDETVTFGLGEEPDWFASLARRGMDSGLELLKTITKLGERPKRYPENNQLAEAFALTRQLVSLDVGVQVFHIPWGSLDTHTGQVGTFNDHMNQYGVALAAFLDDVADAGLSDRVLVATTSEFGRRVEANGSGTDHGTASTMMLAGAVNPGRYGAAPDFARRDGDGNVKATTSMMDYYATLTNSWLGIPTSETLAGKGITPIDGVLR